MNIMIMCHMGLKSPVFVCVFFVFFSFFFLSSSLSLCFFVCFCFLFSCFKHPRHWPWPPWVLALESPKSSVVTTWMGDRNMLGFAPTLRFLHQSQIMCLLYKSPSGETNKAGSPPCVHACKKITYALLWFMSEFVGLWKRPDNPAWTKSVGIFRVLKMDTITDKRRRWRGTRQLSVQNNLCSQCSTAN